MSRVRVNPNPRGYSTHTTHYIHSEKEDTLKWLLAQDTSSYTVKKNILYINK